MDRQHGRCGGEVGRVEDADLVQLAHAHEGALWRAREDDIARLVAGVQCGAHAARGQVDDADRVRKVVDDPGFGVGAGPHADGIHPHGHAADADRGGAGHIEELEHAVGQVHREQHGAVGRQVDRVDVGRLPVPERCARRALWWLVAVGALAGHDLVDQRQHFLAGQLMGEPGLGLDWSRHEHGGREGQRTTCGHGEGDPGHAGKVAVTACPTSRDPAGSAESGFPSPTSPDRGQVTGAPAGASAFENVNDFPTWSTRIESPSVKAPSSNLPASGFSMRCWMTRLSGRAPKCGS